MPEDQLLHPAQACIRGGLGVPSPVGLHTWNGVREGQAGAAFASVSLLVHILLQSHLSSSLRWGSQLHSKSPLAAGGFFCFLLCTLASGGRAGTSCWREGWMERILAPAVLYCLHWPLYCLLVLCKLALPSSLHLCPEPPKVGWLLGEGRMPAYRPHSPWLSPALLPARAALTAWRS